MSNDFGSYTLDWSSPEAPKQVGGFEPWGPWCLDFVVAGGRLFATYTGGRVTYYLPNPVTTPQEAKLYVYDLSVPSRPKRVGMAPAGFFAMGLAVDKSHAYVSDWEGGFHLVDVTNPENPQLLSTHQGPSTAERNRFSWFAYHAYVEAGVAYVADLQGGLELVDVRDKRKPVSLGRYRSDYLVRRVAASGEYVYLAAMYGGIEILHRHSELTIPRRSTDGTIGFTVHMPVPGVHRIQASENLTDWITVDTVEAAGLTRDWVEKPNVSAPRRFYRILPGR